MVILRKCIMAKQFHCLESSYYSTASHRTELIVNVSLQKSDRTFRIRNDYCHITATDEGLCVASRCGTEGADWKADEDSSVYAMTLKYNCISEYATAAFCAASMRCALMYLRHTKPRRWRRRFVNQLSEFRGSPDGNTMELLPWSATAAARVFMKRCVGNRDTGMRSPMENPWKRRFLRNPIEDR